MSEPLPSEIRRVARERLLDAHRRLENKAAEPFDVRVHEARKRTKEVRALLRLARDELGRDTYKRENARLRDAARLLAPAWPELLGPTARETHRLADLLGDDHDLSVLIARLDGLPLAEEDRQRVAEWAAVRQAELRRSALELGACLYAESPKAFVTRIGEIYMLARRGGRIEPALPVAPVAAEDG